MAQSPVVDKTCRAVSPSTFALVCYFSPSCPKRPCHLLAVMKCAVLKDDGFVFFEGTHSKLGGLKGTSKGVHRCTMMAGRKEQ